MTLRAVLARTEHLFIDFDGPMCSTFSAISSADASRELGELLAHHGLPVPSYLIDTADPFALLYYVAANASHLADTAEHALTALELTGVKTAQPTPGLRDLLVQLIRSGRTVTVVSNNSEICVRTFLNAVSLAGHVHDVSARRASDPRLLKPEPHLLLNAIRALGATPAACTLLGDSATDIEAAHRAHTASIAFANRPDKRDNLLAASPNALVSSLHDISAALAL